MCGAITTICATPNCKNYVRYETVCERCKINVAHLTGV